jgi:nucleotide-binding universal stress UspA family protein
MFSLSRIVVPVAFSERCRGAAHYAAAIACRFGSELNLLHVDEPLDHSFGLEPTPALTELARIRRQWATRECEKLLNGHNANIVTAVLEGDPAREIIAFARNHRADLIVMPTHGYGPFRRFLVGSVTAKVLHDAACPVWTGAHMEDPSLPETVEIRSVACAIDLSEHTRAVLEWAAGFADRCSAKLVLFHVIGAAAGSERRALAAEMAMQEITRYQSDLQISAPVNLNFGSVAPTVCAMAKEASADLLVIGRGHGATAAGRLPSKTYAIVRTSPCPVVSV